MFAEFSLPGNVSSLGESKHAQIAWSSGQRSYHSKKTKTNVQLKPCGSEAVSVAVTLGIDVECFALTPRLSVLCWKI